jgi:hypothetical protein
MKEKLINEIENAMSGVLTFEQTAHLSTSLLQILSKYNVVADGDTVHEDFASNARLLEIFLSAKQVEGCSLKTIRYYESTIRHLFRSCLS